jgi:hypothetical protein
MFGLITHLDARIFSTAVLDQECHQGVHICEVRFAIQGAAVPFLRNQSGVHQLGNVV